MSTRQTTRLLGTTLFSASLKRSMSAGTLHVVEIVWFEYRARGEFPPLSALPTVECLGCVCGGVITCACSFFHLHGPPDGRQEGCKGRGVPTLRSLLRSVQWCLLCAEARALEERKMRPVQTPDLPPNASCQGGRDWRSPSSQKHTAFLLFF